MRKKLYVVDEIVEAVFDSANKCILVTWIDTQPHDHFRPCVQAQLECVKTDGAKVLIIDTPNVPSQENLNWLKNHVYPVYQEQGVKAVIIVGSRNPENREATAQWHISGSGFGFDFIEVASRQIAQDLAKMYIDR